MDISGETQTDISHNVVKTRLSSKGEMVPNSAISQLGSDLDKISDAKQDNYCGSCYGGTEPEGGCCNTCESVRQAYVNRGWSFTDPDAIDQVCTPVPPVNECLEFVISRFYSVKTKNGRTN